VFQFNTALEHLASAVEVVTAWHNRFSRESTFARGRIPTSVDEVVDHDVRAV
jgi:hypothetical protein